MLHNIKSFFNFFLDRLNWRPAFLFKDSQSYWKCRYAAGGNSGRGSYGKFADFKAQVINSFVRERAVQSIIEFGCGDGNQLLLAIYPKYLGLDVSENAILACKKMFAADKTKRFNLLRDYSGEKAQLTLSLDVIFHLVEDEIFENYMRVLFDASDEYVIIYSSSHSNNKWFSSAHVKHRVFTNWVVKNLPNWELVNFINGASGSVSSFYFYRKAS